MLIHYCTFSFLQKLTKDQRRLGKSSTCNIVGPKKNMPLQGNLPPAIPFGSSFLIPPAWSAFLRLILQLGTDPSHLRKLVSSEEEETASGEGDSNLEADLWRVFPEKVKHAWQQSSRPLTVREAQVKSLLPQFDFVF